MEGCLTEEGRNSPFPLPFCNVWVRAVLSAAAHARTCKVWYRMPLYLNSTSISLDFAAACYNGITRKGKEGKHDVCKDELEGSKGKVR